MRPVQLVVPELDLTADLVVELTTSAGEAVNAQVRSARSEVTIDVDRPEALLGALDRAEVGRVADLLADLGAVAHVVGPDGQLAQLGAGVSSRIGRLITGSDRFAPTRRAAPVIAAGVFAAIGRKVRRRS